MQSNRDNFERPVQNGDYPAVKKRMRKQQQTFLGLNIRHSANTTVLGKDETKFAYSGIDYPVTPRF